MLSTEVFSEGTPLIIRTLEGDSEVIASKDRYIMIGVFGEVYSMRATTFEKIYSASEQAYNMNPEDMNPEYLSYQPTIRDKITGESKKSENILRFAKACTPKEGVYIRETA